MRFFDDPGKALQQMGDELLEEDWEEDEEDCLLYTSPSPRD